MEGQEYRKIAKTKFETENHWETIGKYSKETGIKKDILPNTEPTCRKMKLEIVIL